MQKLSDYIHYKNIKQYVAVLKPDEVIEYNKIIDTLEQNIKQNESYSQLNLQLNSDNVYRHLRQNLIERGFIVTKDRNSITIDLVN